jgi:hypothetical protein
MRVAGNVRRQTTGPLDPRASKDDVGSYFRTVKDPHAGTTTAAHGWWSGILQAPIAVFLKVRSSLTAHNGRGPPYRPLCARARA